MTPFPLPPPSLCPSPRQPYILAKKPDREGNKSAAKIAHYLRLRSLGNDDDKNTEEKTFIRLTFRRALKVKKLTIKVLQLRCQNADF